MDDPFSSLADEQFLRAVRRESGGAGRRRRGKPPVAMYWWPSMKLAEEQSSYLAELHDANRAPKYLENIAQGLSIWHDYLATRRKPRPWHVANLDDLLDFKDRLGSRRSALTRRVYGTGSVQQYMLRVIGFYAHGRAAGWYHGDIANADATAQESGRPRSRGLHGLQAIAYVPKVHPSNQRGRPIPSEHLTRMMELADSSEPLDGCGEEVAGAFAMSRDQLLLSWGWAVGLRVSEVVGKGGLTFDQFDSVNPDPAFPLKELPFEVRGKGGKQREVGVPAWLVLATKAYVCEVDPATAKSRGAKPVFGISARRVEQIIADLCFKAGYVESDAEGHGRGQPNPLGLYRFHDLRHTYAVARYHAESALGNPEPWKAIQVQLGHAHLQTTINTYLRWVGGATPFRFATASGLLGLPTPQLQP
jgi:integrase